MAARIERTRPWYAAKLSPDIELNLAKRGACVGIQMSIQSRVRYEWDPDKAEANLKAHGVSFSDAVLVLEDEFALTREDPDAEGEQRFVTLGADAAGHLLVVVHTYREPDVTRLISAWKANKTQRTQYENHRR